METTDDTSGCILAAVLILAACVGPAEPRRAVDGRARTSRSRSSSTGADRAWGQFQDRFGEVRRRFRVEVDGTWDGETLTLVEDFVYNDGADRAAGLDAAQDRARPLGPARRPA